MTARQFYLTLFIFSITLRVQKMPALMAGELGKDSYLLILLFFAIAVIGISLAFFILKCLKKFEIFGKTGFQKFFKSLVLILISFYFLMQSLLMYEAIQDLFAHVLFDNLPWTLFSLLLIFLLFYLVKTGLSNIGKVVEIYFGLMVVSYLILAIFGGMQTDFSEILPFETINFPKICDNFVTFNLWFGDFFMVLFLGKHSSEIKLKWTLLAYSLAMMFVVLVTIEFYGMYTIYSPMQPSLISVLSEQSMLGVDVGRVDWFLILFSEFGAILSSGLCLYFSSQTLCEAFPKIKPLYILLTLLLGLYHVDVLYLVDLNAKIEVFLGFAGIFTLTLKVVVFVLILLICLCKYFGQKKQKAVRYENIH